MFYPYTYINDLKDHVGQTVTLAGWCYSRRSSGKIRFVIIRDGTGLCQCVASTKDVSPEVFALLDTIDQESAIKITGVVRAFDRAPGGHELGITGCEVLSPAKDYPITPKEHGVAFLMENRHLWLRSKRQVAILRVRHQIIASIRGYFNDLNFTLVDAPIFTPNACEGTSTLFETDYFGEQAYLTQSGQLYMEAAAMALGKVYCFGPTFRAEKSKTRRHLTEFWMVEPEVAFMDLDGDMELAEGLLCRIVKDVLNNCRDHLTTLERDVSVLEKIVAPFPRISYDDALKLLAEKKQQLAASSDPEEQKLAADILKNGPGDDLGAADETVLSKHYDKPVMVHRYPTKVKAFYMKADPANPERVLCVDVLAPEGIGEIIGGAQREDDLAVLERKIAEHKLSAEAFKWYVDVRRYGSVPHAGFGLGIERTVGWICGLHHVRESNPFPRMMEKIWP